MPQAYYMLCRKFPDSYNKDSQAPYQLFRADIKIAVSCRSCGAEGAVVLVPGSTVRMHLLLGTSWYLRLILCPLSLGGHRYTNQIPMATSKC